jgi:Na+-transporting methylmalonyl-CoA/oxaloacetate decarboxylase gamma subunit
MNNLNNILSFLTGSTLDKATLTWTVPIVGITIVMLSITFLAFILKQLIWLNPKAMEEKKAKNTNSNLSTENTQNEISTITQSSNGNEDEISVAISTALYLHISDAGSSVNLTELPEDFNVSPWKVIGRNVQTANFNRWQSQKRWSK